jgi:hypothetical protein
MALRLGIDLKLFDAAASKNGEEISIQELAEATKADPLLVSKCHGTGCLVEEKTKLTINRADYEIPGSHGHFQRRDQGLVCLDASRRILCRKFSVLSSRHSCVRSSHFRQYSIL